MQAKYSYTYLLIYVLIACFALCILSIDLNKLQLEDLDFCAQYWVS